VSIFFRLGPMNLVRFLRQYTSPPAVRFEDEILKHSDDLWKEFHLDSTVPGLRMWKRRKQPISPAVYMKFTAFFPHVGPSAVLPLLWDATRRGWDPNFATYSLVEKVSDTRCIVYNKSRVPRWMRYLKVKPRDYVQELTLRRHRASPLSYFITHQSIPYPSLPPGDDAVRGTIHFQGCLIEEAQFEGVPGTQVTVMSINDIKLPAGMYKFVNQVLRRYPTKWYNSLAAAVGCTEKRHSWRPSPIPWLSDAEYVTLFYLPG